MAQSNRAQLQKVCDLWNARHPVGTQVLYQPVQGDLRVEAVTEGIAYVLSGRTAVVNLKDVTGPVELESVRARALTPTQRTD
jgi:hypothetical protein